MTTMKDIALRTGVSVSTVSLVLNGRDEGRVKPHIAQQVRQVAQELCYRPNAVARSLRTNRSRLLGFVSLEVATTPYAGGIILGAQEAASKAGYVLATVSADGNVDLEQEIRSLDRHGVDGFLFSAMSNRMYDIPDALASHPLVLADTTDTRNRFPSIVPDEFRIGYDATQRLIRAGLTRIAYIGCSAPMIAQDGRLAGYRRALEDAGFEYDEALVCDVLFNDSALAKVERLFDESHPDGFFCFNDSRTWYVYECAAKRGLKIGQDISVVGVDNHPVVSETFSPRLTTIELPHYEMGYWAAAKLITMIDGDDTAFQQWPHTTAPLPALESSEHVAIHCTMLERDSVRR